MSCALFATVTWLLRFFRRHRLHDIAARFRIRQSLALRFNGNLDMGLVMLPEDALAGALRA